MSVEDGGLLAGELGGRAQQSYARAAASMRAAHSEAADPPCWISVIVGVEPLQCPVLPQFPAEALAGRPDSQPAGSSPAQRSLDETARSLPNGSSCAVRPPVGSPPQATRERINGAIGEILTAGVADKTLRSDVTADDVTTMILGIVLATGPTAFLSQMKRLLDVLVDGLGHHSSSSRSN